MAAESQLETLPDASLRPAGPFGFAQGRLARRPSPHEDFDRGYSPRISVLAAPMLS
jgi:hypothetical protein